MNGISKIWSKKYDAFSFLKQANKIKSQLLAENSKNKSGKKVYLFESDFQKKE